MPKDRFWEQRPSKEMELETQEEEEASLEDDAELQGFDVSDLHVGVVPTNLICLQCKKVLRAPSQSHCGHRFCTSCIGAILR